MLHGAASYLLCGRGPPHSSTTKHSTTLTSSTMVATVVIVAAAAISLYLFQIVFSIFSTARKPGLSSIPNAHWTTPYTRLWLLWHRGKRQEHSTRHAAHKKLGPVIRIAPKEISIDCIDGGIQTVYGGNWDKADFYSAFENYGYKNTTDGFGICSS